MSNGGANAPIGIQDGHETRIPAWKRIGLKLKYAKDTADTTRLYPSFHSPHSTAQSGQELPEDGPSKKRKRVAAPTFQPLLSNSEPPTAKTSNLNREAKRKKKVTFESTDGKATPQLDTGIDPSTGPEGTVSGSGSVIKRHDSKTSKSPQLSNQKSHASLTYLDQYNTSRQSWKFNKNKEIWLLKNALSTEHIPSSYNLAFSNYLRSLRGDQARSRLCASAQDAIDKDKRTEFDIASADTGAREDDQEAKSIKRTVSIPMDDPATCRKVYENAVQRYRDKVDRYLESEDDDLDIADAKLQQRLAKRKRAELIIWSLGPSKDADDLLRRTQHGDRSQKNSGSSPIVEASKGSKAKQIRKVRTANMDDLSSSSGSDDEDSSGSNGRSNLGSFSDSADSTSPSETDITSQSDTDSASTLQVSDSTLDSESTSDLGTSGSDEDSDEKSSSSDETEETT